MNQQRRVHTEQAPRLNGKNYQNVEEEEDYDINQLPDGAEDLYENEQEANEDSGQPQVPADQDAEDIDFNNYKGIYAEDDAGQKYQCPDTGAHFEPKDLCKRIYKIIEKRKPFEIDLYGQDMLVDGVGSSLIAAAPYADQSKQVNLQSSYGQAEHYVKKQITSGQVPNARAGSKK